VQSLADTRFPLHGSAMRLTQCSILTLLIALGGCAGASDPREALSERIERTARLPKGAAPLASYERYYAARDGVILAIYTNHSEDDRKRIAEECRKTGRPVFPCPPDNGDVQLVRAGQRLWVNDWQALPRKSGGGCSQVDLEYLLNENRFVRLECNGDY